MGRRPNSRFVEELGPGGLSSLLLALVSGLLGVGLPVWWQRRRVLARADGHPPEPADVIVVLGRELEPGDRPSEIYRARLEHGAELLRRGLARTILVSGGLTGTARRTEAEVGRRVLVERGVPESAILVEERSRFTLENLFNARRALAERGLARVILVSDPLHLARAEAFALGLSLDVRCSPAAEAPPGRGGLAWHLRAIREAFLLHWYRVGVAYSRLIRSRRLLSRVT